MTPDPDKPRYDFAALTPELFVSDIRESLRFWCGGLGFRIVYETPEDGFAYLERGPLQVMLDQYKPDAPWKVAAMERPFGRGNNLKMIVEDLDAVLSGLQALDWPLFLPLEEAWYPAGPVETGNRQFLVQDPDGYLLRFAQDLGTRPVRNEP